MLPASIGLGNFSRRFSRPVRASPLEPSSRRVAWESRRAARTPRQSLKRAGHAAATGAIMRKLRFGLWYDFRNPPQWRQDPARLYESIIAQAARAEALGWDDVWLSEHHFIEDGYTPSMLPLAAAIAARSQKIRIGTSVLLLPLHDPLRVA